MSGISSMVANQSSDLGKRLSSSKSTVVELLPNRANQEDWLKSLLAMLRAVGAVQLAMPEHNVSRRVTSRDLMPQGPLSIKTDSSANNTPTNNVKEERETDQSSSSSSSEWVLPPKGGLTRSPLSKPPARTTALIRGGTTEYEKLILEQLNVFVDPETNLDESPEKASLRFQCFTVALRSVSKFARVVQHCEPGNLYELINLIITDFKSTGRSRYNSLAALGQIKFGTEDC